MHDPPEHARLRLAISWAFMPAEVQPLCNRIVTLTDRALDVMAGKGGGNVIAELAYPLPAAVIGELLGLSLEDTEQFQVLAALSVTAPGRGTRPHSRSRLPVTPMPGSRPASTG